MKRCTNSLLTPTVYSDFHPAPLYLFEESQKSPLCSMKAKQDGGEHIRQTQQRRGKRQRATALVCCFQTPLALRGSLQRSLTEILIVFDSCFCYENKHRTGAFFFGERTDVRPSIGLAPIRNNCCGQKRESGGLETARSVQAASLEMSRCLPV